MTKTEFTHDGLMIAAQDLSAISPKSEDHDRMFHHDGSSSISIVGGSSTGQRGYYIWDKDDQSWYPLFHNADKLDGKDSGAFLHRDGSLPMLDDLDLDHNGLLNTDTVESGVGRLSLNSNNVSISALSAGVSIKLKDNNGLLLLNALEGGDVNIPNGTLSESGQRVATRSWTNANADVSNADYADNADQLDGNQASAFLHVTGDQMEGTLDLGENNVEDGADVLWNALNSEVPQASLGGPASSLNAYPLGSGDLAEDYALTSRFPLPATDLAEDYVLTSRLPLPAGDLVDDYALTSRFPIPNSDVANSSVTVTAGNQLTGGGSVSLGGTITVDVDENNLDADTVDGNEAASFLSVSGDSMAGVLDVAANDVKDGLTTVWDASLGEVPQAVLGGPASSLSAYPLANSDLSNSTITVAGNAVGLGGSTSVALGDLSNVTATGEGTGNGLDADLLDGEHATAFADSGHLHDSRYLLESGDTLSGVLTLSDGSKAASRSWVNGNADVPNADYADTAGDADTVDSVEASQFLRSDTADTLNATLSVSGETEVQFGGSNYQVRYDTTRDTLVLGSAENGPVAEVDNAGNFKIEGSLTEGATIGD